MSPAAWALPLLRLRLVASAGSPLPGNATREVALSSEQRVLLCEVCTGELQRPAVAAAAALRYERLAAVATAAGDATAGCSCAPCSGPPCAACAITCHAPMPACNAGERPRRGAMRLPHVPEECPRVGIRPGQPGCFDPAGAHPVLCTSRLRTQALPAASLPSVHAGAEPRPLLCRRRWWTSSPAAWRWTLLSAPPPSRSCSAWRSCTRRGAAGSTPPVPAAAARAALAAPARIDSGQRADPAALPGAAAPASSFLLFVPMPAPPGFRLSVCIHVTLNAHALTWNC